MSRISLLVLLSLFANICFAQTTYTWVGGANGDYQNSTNWSPVRAVPAANDVLAFNATSPIKLANVPTQTIGAISILSGTSSVTFTANAPNLTLTLSAPTPLIYTTAGSILAGDLLSITLANTTSFIMSSGTFGIESSTGGKININGSLTLNGGTLAFDVVGTGGTTIGSGGSITYTSGTFVSNNASAITWANGSNYYHNVSGSAANAIPVSLWSTGSTCNITGYNVGSVAPAGLTSTAFSNFRWNAASQVGNVDLDLSGLPFIVNGNLNIVSTGAGKVRFTGTGISSITAGSYTQTNGYLALQASSGSTTLLVKGAFNQTGGTIDFVTNGGTGDATLNMQGDVFKRVCIWASSSGSSNAVANVQFSGNNIQNVTITHPVDISGGRLNIINTNTDPSGVSITSPTTLIVKNANSPLPASCSNAGNFSGAGIIQYTGGGTGGSVLIYNGTSAQKASTVEFDNTSGVSNVTISSSGTVTFPFNRTIAGTLTMTSGSINFGTYTLSLTNPVLANQLVYTNGFISGGTLSRSFPATGLPTDALSNSSLYPFGSGSNSRFINVYFSSSTGSVAGDIAISHFADVNAVAIAPVLNDAGVALDKRSGSYWIFNTGSFDPGISNGISIRALGTNIGAVNNLSTLRLTDASTPNLGTLIATSGTVDAPVVGKSGLTTTDINGKTLYIGSDFQNPLAIVSFVWTGAISTSWTNSGNWTSTNGSGYPSAPTENATISSAPFGRWPVMVTGDNMSVYQLTVTAPAVLTMNGTSSLSVYDNVVFTGTASFQPTSTFMYASPSVAQNIVNLPYGTLGISGAGSKIFPATTTVTGDFVANANPTFPANANFIYDAGAAVQRVAATNYVNLTITGSRGGNTIRLGNGVSANTIKVTGLFNVTATNFNATNDKYNTFDFAAPNPTPQTIPGFVYGFISSSTGGPRTLDPLGSVDPTHVISCKGILANPKRNTVTGSKIKLDRTGSNTNLGYYIYNDLEVSGNMAGASLGGLSVTDTIFIAGTFSISATNFKLSSTPFTMNFNGSGSQTIPGFKANTGTNTPAWKYVNLIISNSNRDITLSPTDTIYVQGSLTVPTPASFSSGGFITTGSTVDFMVGSGLIPILKPKAGLNNYNNVVLESGVRIMEGDLVLGGNLTIRGLDTAAAQFNIGNGVNNRTLTVLGNININGAAGPSPFQNSLLDFNTGNALTSLVKLYGNLNVSNGGLISTVVTGNNKGTIQFIGGSHQYNNTSTQKNGFVNFTVGDGILPDTLTLNTNIDLTRSAIAPFSSSFNVSDKGVLIANTKNIKVGTDDGNATNAVFNLNAGATLVTSNTGGAAASTDFALEGAATSGSTGTVQVNGITRNYDIAANYVLNGATVNPFPAPALPPFTMNNLTIGANVSLNRGIDVNGTLDLKANILTQAGNDLEFNGLTSSGVNGRIYADQASTITIRGDATPVGALRFVVPGGNITGQFNLNKGITVPLLSDLTIQKGTKSGDFITGDAASVLDILGNTLTINGDIAAADPGALGGSDSSNLTLGGTSTVKFAAGKQVLKNFTLTTGATSTLGTDLAITGGLTPGNEGTVSVLGTAVLNTADRLTIKSNDKGTARIAQGRSSGGYINGQVIVERFLRSERSWRLLSTPTIGQTIRQAWQENGTNPGGGFGTIITSNQSNFAANGFDFQTPGNSLLTYDSNTDKWVGVPNTFSQLTAAGANKAYYLFLRGDRTVNPGVSNPPTPANIRSKGTIFQGDLAAVPVNAGQFVSVSNNYASAVNFLSLTKTNLDASFIVWDPLLPGTNNLGAWVTFSAATGWKPSIAGGSYADVASTRIESGQGFFVRNSTALPGSITFKESDKIAGSTLVSRPAGIKTILQTNLAIVDNGTTRPIDGSTVVFSDEYSNELDRLDARKLANFSENFGMRRNGNLLVVEARQPVVETDTVFFDMFNMNKQAYRIELKPESFGANVSAYLEDNYLHTTTPVSANGTTNIDFEINDEAASAAANRFRVVFKNSAVATAVAAASEKNNGISIDWNIISETNVASYELEKSVDGRSFTKIYSAAATKGTNATAAYNWLDTKAAVGDNYYRVKVIGKSGTFSYSNIVNVNLVAAKTGFSVFPNPVSDGIIGLKMRNVAAGNYSIKILSNDGKLMSQELVKHAGGSSSKNLTSASKLASGTYQVEITGPDKKVDVIRILVF